MDSVLYPLFYSLFRSALCCFLPLQLFLSLVFLFVYLDLRSHHCFALNQDFLVVFFNLFLSIFFASFVVSSLPWSAYSPLSPMGEVSLQWSGLSTYGLGQRINASIMRCCPQVAFPKMLCAVRSFSAMVSSRYHLFQFFQFFLYDSCCMFGPSATGFHFSRSV